MQQLRSHETAILITPWKIASNHFRHRTTTSNRAASARPLTSNPPPIHQLQLQLQNSHTHGHPHLYQRETLEAQSSQKRKTAIAIIAIRRAARVEGRAFGFCASSCYGRTAGAQSGKERGSCEGGRGYWTDGRRTGCAKTSWGRGAGSVGCVSSLLIRSAFLGPATTSRDLCKRVGTERFFTSDTEAPTSTESTTNTNTEPTNTSKKRDKMATDEEYMAFLDKANEDPSAGTAKSQSKGKAELKATDTDVPAPLTKATKDAYYMSDADEPFVPVALKFGEKTLPDEAAFAKLVNHPDPKKATVEIIDIGEWDPQGQYKDVVEATREVSKGSDVRVYRISKDGARAEYWVVGLEGGKLLGVKALAVES